jgi:site-specific DNA recombinase
VRAVSVPDFNNEETKMKSAKAEGLFLRAAIYVRKSNSDNDKNAEDKSVARQIAHSRDFITRKGWRLAGAEHVYADDAISGAEFKHRPALNRLLAALPESGAPPFDVLVMSEHSRLGRDVRNTGSTFGTIIEAGVRVFFYMTDEELKLDTDEQEIMLSLRGYGSTAERSKAVVRARDKALSLAQAGRNYGGRCYGYDNVWLMPDGTVQPGVLPAGAKPTDKVEDYKPPIAQTLYRINPVEAAVVRAMFRMYADGHGGKSIAYCVNGDPAHRAALKQYFDGTRPAGPRGAANWSANTIHDLLRNPRYLGNIPYGATLKTYIKGTKRRIPGAEQLFPAPALRIIAPPLAAAVGQRVERMAKIYLRATNGQLGGRPETGRASRYLLSGLMRCEGCGAAMIVSAGSTGSGRTRQQVRHYVCSGRSNRGPTACSNGVRPRLDALDREVLTAIGHHITPAVIRAAARRAVEMIRAQNATVPNKAKQLRRELAAAEAKVANYLTAIGAGGSRIASLVAELAAAEARCAALREELAAADSPPALEALSDERLEHRLTARAAHWREVLAGDPPLARQALRALLAGPILFAPAPDGYRLRGATKVGALWVPEKTRVKMASPGGFEPPYSP